MRGRKIPFSPCGGGEMIFFSRLFLSNQIPWGGGGGGSLLLLPSASGGRIMQVSKAREGFTVKKKQGSLELFCQVLVGPWFRMLLFPKNLN